MKFWKYIQWKKKNLLGPILIRMKILTHKIKEDTCYVNVAIPCMVSLIMITLVLLLCWLLSQYIIVWLDLISKGSSVHATTTQLISISRLLKELKIIPIQNGMWQNCSGKNGPNWLFCWAVQNFHDVGWLGMALFAGISLWRFWDWITRHTLLLLFPSKSWNIIFS